MSEALISAIYAALIAFAINIILCPIIIPLLVKLKFGQNIRSDGPKTHLKKAGTPTMGGIMITISFIAASLFFISGNSEGLAVILVTLGYGVIGFLDDYIMIIKKRSLGLKPMQKIIGQLLITTCFIIYIYFGSAGNFTDNITEILIPFTQGRTIDLGILYIPFVYFVMVACVNGVNITDGLDGLAPGVTLLVTIFFLFAAWAAGSGLTPIAGAAAGSLLGFLLFNSYPARVIMGDTGSLALGGFIGSVAILLKMPLFVVIVGIIYVIESASSLIQIGCFKLTGKRVFKMAPIHHSFELSGWSETKIVALFYVITAISCLIGFLAAQYIF